MGPKVNALLAAITAARGRAEEAAARMETRAAEIQARMARLQSFQGSAGEIAAAVRDLTAFAQQAKGPKEILDRMGPVEERISKAQQEARDEDFEDVAHDLANMKELLASMRRKLGGK
jgi:hypothetical protein